MRQKRWKFIYLLLLSTFCQKKEEHLGQKLLFCWRKGIADCWGHLISISICLSAWMAISGCHSWRANENILHQISSSLMQLFTSAESLMICRTSSLTSFGLLLCSPCSGVFRRTQRDAEPRAVTGLATRDSVWDSAQLWRQHKLVIQPGTAGQQWSVANTWLRNIVRADPKELLWRKPLKPIKGLPLVPKFLIKNYLYVSLAKQANFKLCISWKKSEYFI